ncbi:tape measure protein [Phocaeicola vulgatus]|uniref:tape measure protein n=1 Tax=Phocaeicola vulgatus TaxID=821 RepID=UPI00189CE5F3|nr:tape measure protein [Phocaeicola vulgatus]MDB1059846.1 tape measure protein [Phocaeicola vulgatus]
MANNEAGAFLNITPDVLKKLDSFDEKLEKIEKHAHTAADALKNGFGSVVVDTSKLESAITSLANKIGALNTAGRAVGNIGTSMNEVSKDATRAASSLSSVAQTLNRVKPDNGLAKSVEQYRNISAQIEQISSRQKQLNDIVKSYELTMSRIQSGKGGVIQAGQQQQVQSARQELEANNQLLATLRQKQQEIVNTNKAYQQQVQLAQQLRNLEQERNSLPNQRSKQTLADMRAYYSELEKSSARAAKAAEQAAERESRADEKRYNEWLRRKAHEEKEALRISNAKAKAEEQAMRASLLSYRNTPQGALDYSKNAKSLRDQVTAINYLKQARLSLNTTDKNYQSTLQQINLAISRHNQALQQAGVQSQSLARNHRNLMDTAGQLSRQLALVFSVSQIEGYISKLANVRGEFELQQRSLEAILQNKAQADQIFNKTVQLAVKSPFQIKELVTFTKQLAAYRIESDKLYDTTKRLADVSAGLGVDMGRLILAYGQVKAAAYLRGTEVRQFTEAGINMYGELQKLFKTRDQADYTTAQIVDMISKRKVTFEDVEQVFENLTSKEGIFYNMQEIQAETLQGKISNLKDSIDVMLNSIGKANEDTLKGSIDSIKVLIDNWETVVNIAKAFAPIIASMAITVWAKKIGVANGAIGLFSVGLGKAGNAIKAFGATFKASLPLVAITAAIGIVTEFINTIKEYNKAIAESTNKYFEAKIRISTITDESESDIKKSLDKLVQEMNNEGFDIKVGVNLSEEEAKETFKNYLLEYEAFLNEQRIMEAKYAKNKSKWIVDDIDEDSEQYTSSIGEFILQGEELKAIMMQLATEENNLSAEHRKALEELSKGPKKGEDLLTYTKRMKDEVAGMWPYLSNAFNSMRLGNGMYTQEVMKARNSLTELFALSKKYIENEKEMISELESVYGSVDKYKTEAEKKRLKIRIDKSELDAVTKDLAYKHFGINISINQDSVEKETSWLDSYLKTFFEKKTYKINLNMTQPIDAKVPFEDFIKKGNEASKAAKSWEEVEKRIAAIGKNVKQIEADSKIANFLNSQNPVLNIKSGDMVDVKLILETISEYKKTQVDLSNALGVNPFGNKGSIWAERISVLKEMQSRYEKLNQLMGENAAIEQTLSAFKPALEFTGMDKMNILPTKEGMIKAYEELLKDVTDSKKITELKKIIAELKIEIQQEDLKNQLETTKKNIEDLFNGLDLYNKMKKEGFSDEMIKSLFGDLTTTESEIQAEIEKLAGKEGELWEKAYDDLNKKLKSKQDEMFKNRIEQYAQFINDFNNQIENKQEEFADYMKIARDMLNKTGDVKAFTDQVGNIIAKYNQDIAKIETEKFKKSGTYIEMMGELSIKSADELQALIESLEDFIAKSASNIPADTLKIYINRLNEANEQLDKVKNPFGKSFIKGIKEITELQNKYNAEKSYQNELLQKQVELENELRDIESKRDIAKANGDDTTNFENQIVDIQDLIKDNDNSIANSSAKLQGMSTQMGKMTQGAGAVIGIIDKIVKGIDDSIQATADLFNEIKDIASSYGVDTESGGWQDLSIAMSSLSEMSTNVSNSWNSFKSGDFAGAAVSAIKSVGSVIKGINAIHDAKYERKIKRQQKNIESLQDAYEILKEKIDKAWDITSLNNATKQTTQNIDQQIRSYQEMINAEQKKKDTDDERIKEWNEAIKELQKTKEEIIKQEQMDLGGIGGESEYRDAAESFVQAWMDAFNETEDGLKALNENFNDFIENLIVKQATMRLAQARLKNLFDMIDKSVTEDSDGGISITQKELADIYAEATTSMKGLNEDLLSFVETLGYKPSKKANLSALQQGIQGITETTAEALEALLNSIRFFVSQQTTDITAIRNLLDARYSLESQAETNPMLIELKAQTGYLEIISDRIDRVFAPNSNSRGAGLRVFISD